MMMPEEIKEQDRKHRHMKDFKNVWDEIHRLQQSEKANYILNSLDPSVENKGKFKSEL
jgi:hypothetical protein